MNHAYVSIPLLTRKIWFWFQKSKCCVCVFYGSTLLPILQSSKIKKILKTRLRKMNWPTVEWRLAAAWKSRDGREGRVLVGRSETWRWRQRENPSIFALGNEFRREWEGGPWGLGLRKEKKAALELKNYNFWVRINKP